MTRSKFIDYVFSFYGPNSDLYPIPASKKQISKALDTLIARGDAVEFDSIDREKIRDIMLAENAAHLKKILAASAEITKLIDQTRPAFYFSKNWIRS